MGIRGSMLRRGEEIRGRISLVRGGHDGGLLATKMHSAKKYSVRKNYLERCPFGYVLGSQTTNYSCIAKRTAMTLFCFYCNPFSHDCRLNPPLRTI